VPDGARFCPSCGHPQFAVAPEERRVVTVLFADVVGFTALAEGSDPERVKRLIDATFERLVADVELFGGRVDKLLGDGILALFGAPVAHEDDAERAVRAALKMHESLLVDFDDQSGEHQVQLRIGINTGEVLVGTLAGTDYTAMGDVVNTAARLQTLAPPGGVLVGEDTRELCSDAIRFDELAPTQLRGRERVERVFLATGLEPGVGRRRWLSAAPFVGRSIEVGMLDSVGRLVAGGRSAVVTVSGEAGIGKSRLVDEVLAGFRSGHPTAAVLQGACSPYGESDVWSPISAAIATQYGIERGRTADEIRRLAARRAAELLGVDADSPPVRQEVEVLLHLLGHASELDRLDPAGARDALFGAVIAGLRRRAQKGPVVLWIDDLQWAHSLLVELLEVVVRSLADLPLLLVVALRTSDEVEWPPFVERALAFHLPLRPLSEQESAVLVGEVTGGTASDELAARLYERSGGNPLFLTELALLAATGESGGLDDELPGSLRALIAARLDQLDADERVIIDNASILGSQGPVAGLATFASAMGQRFDPQLVDALVTGGLLELDGSWWRFRSDVVREVAYQTLTKQARAQRHAGVAAVLAGDSNPPLDELAHHAAAAAELLNELGYVPGVPAHIREQAIDLLAQAAQRAYDIGGYRQGVEVSQRALALTPERSTARRPLLLLHAAGLVETRALPAARADLAEVFATAVDDGDRVAEGEAFRLLGTVEQLDGDLVSARHHLGRAVEIFRELGDKPRLAVALRERGFTEVFGGSLQDAGWYLGEADGLYESLDDARGRAWVAQYQAWISFLSGDHAEAEGRLQGAIDTFESIGDHSGITMTRGLLAYVLYFQRRFDAAEALADDVLREARHWGDEWGASMMLALSANLRLWTGRFGEAAQASERALAGFRKIGDLFGTLQALAPLNRARAALGRHADAERGLEEIVSVGESFGGMAFPSIAASGVAMHLGDGERAVMLATEAIERMAETGASLDEARVQLAMGHLQVGRADDAMAAMVDVAVERSPFALATRSLVFAAIGDLERALADADAVEGFDQVGYFDRLVAAAGGAAAASRSGTTDAADRREQVGALAAGSGDVVLGAFVRSLLFRLGDETPTAGPEPSGGWRMIVDHLVGEPA
jgi:class 3 adenylate cyclase/tetratricopeptide (TPR) repeat protein